MPTKIDNYSFLEKELEFAKLEIINLHDDIHELIAERDALRAKIERTHELEIALREFAWSDDSESQADCV